MQFPDTGLWVMIANDFICQNYNRKILCSRQFYTQNGILIPFPMTVMMHFLRNCVIIMEFFFIWIFTKRMQRRPLAVLCRFRFLPKICPPPPQDRLNAPRTTSVWNGHVSHSYCFLLECAESNTFLRIVLFHVSQKPRATLASRCPNDNKSCNHAGDLY